MTPRGLIVRAVAIALIYFALALGGARADTAFLSGTPVGGAPAVALGCAYLLFHFLFILVVPVLALGALLLRLRNMFPARFR